MFSCSTKNGTGEVTDELISNEEIVKYVKSMRIRMLGHIIRIEDGRMHGSRRRGTLIRKWVQDVRKTL